MSNKYGISKKDEKEIRARDTSCVYCHRKMKAYSRALCSRSNMATIEHFNNDGPFDKKSNLAICCVGCNASRGNKNLLDWFKTPYCIKKNINTESVAKPVKAYLQNLIK